MRMPLVCATLVLASVALAQAPPALRGVLGAVTNGDFAQLSDDGKGFAGWQFIVSRNATVSVAVDATGGRGGGTAPRFHDESPVSPHVYGRFRQTVKVLPGMGYRLSCWCKAEKAPGGNHWTDWKSYSLGLPGGTYDWRKIEARFATKPDQTELDLGLNVVDVTDKLWVDDLVLEPELSTAQAGEMWLGFWSSPAVNTEQEELAYRVWATGVPEGGKLRAEVAAGQEQVGHVELAPAATGEVNGKLKLTDAAERAGTVRVSVVSGGGKVLLTAERPVDLFSAAYVQACLARVKQQAVALSEAMAGWERKGLPTDYPRVTATVAENFLPWIEGDIKQGNLPLAAQELDELGEALTGALAQCASPPPVAALTVPRYTGGPIRITGGHFASQVRWLDGKTEQRPVFFMGYGHFSSVQRDLEKFPAYGLNIIQVEFGPSSVVQPDLTCKTDVVDDFLKLLDRGAQAGVAVNLLLSPHYFPQWAYEKWPELGDVKGGFIHFDVDAPQARQVEEAFLKAVIPKLKGHPALHSLCLSNEPVYISAPKSIYNLQKWHAWLTQRHGDIAKLNALYGTQYASFDDVPIRAADDLRESPQLYDWVTFNNERFAGWHRWMADIIHSLAPDLPVHAKIMNMPFSRGTLMYGNDVEQFCGLSQIAGNDCCNWVQRREDSRFGDDWRGEMQFYDLLRSMRGQPVFNSENHVVLDRDWGPVPGMHMRSLIWQGALHGLGASTMWVWERNTTDPRSDFAGSVMHRPILCDAHGRAALDLMRLAPEMVALQDQPARVALVYSIASMVWNQRYPSLVGETYEALAQLGEKVDFLTWGQLARGEGQRYRAIILPGVTHLEGDGFRGLQEFAALKDKQLLAVGEGCPGADEYGRPRDLTGLPLVTLGEDDLAAKLRAALKLDWPVQVAVGGAATPAPFVGFRWARDGGRWLINVSNYGRRPATVRVTCAGAKRVTNLFTAQPVQGDITLQPMEPVLIEAR